MHLSFNLDKHFVDSYREKPEPFGFGLVGPIAFYRTYARPLDDRILESWADTCERVINGMYSIQKDYCYEHGILWDENKAQGSAKEAYDRLFKLKWSPPGRGLYNMGTPSVHERWLVESLQNCGFITTANIDKEGGNILKWIMMALMLGVGVGADVTGARHRLKIHPVHENDSVLYVIPDSREGWGEALKLLFDSYIYNRQKILFDYSQIRPKGSAIKGFGGVASGPEPLRWMLEKVRTILDEKSRSEEPYLDERVLADIINLIGVVVVAGNVRRSSEILLGPPDSKVFPFLKNYAYYPERAEYGWASNNSVYAELGMNYLPFVERIFDNGEPGFIWLDNINNYARMNGIVNKEDKATGINPCGEQPLEGFSAAGTGGELCTLAEVYLNRHNSIQDFFRSLKYAFLYGKTVTLLSEKIKFPGTREIMQRNRRIGVSLTGITQFIEQHGIEELRRYTTNGYEMIQHYDLFYSLWLGVNQSVRTTTVKPSGTVSLLAGATPGVHYPHAQYYIRRIRLAENSYLVERLKRARVPIVRDLYSRDTMIAEIPVRVENFSRAAKQVSVAEQLALASFMQRFWSDNSVSVTVSIDPSKNTPSDIARLLSYYQYNLKSVSFLPETDEGTYEQMPYEAIDEYRYRQLNGNIDYDVAKTFRYLEHETTDQIPEKFCDGSVCSL